MGPIVAKFEHLTNMNAFSSYTAGTRASGHIHLSADPTGEGGKYHYPCFGCEDTKAQRDQGQIFKGVQLLLGQLNEVIKFAKLLHVRVRELLGTTKF